MVNTTEAILEKAEIDYMATPYTTPWITALLPKQTIGAYVLISHGQPIYVGRSDSCLRTRLLNHEHRSKGSHVIWEIKKSSLEAYHQECFWYQALKQKLINQIAPALPSGIHSISPFLKCDCEELSYKLISERIITMK